MNKNKETLGSTLVVAAGACWGFQNVFVKMLSQYSLSPMQIGFIKMLVAAIVFSVILLIKDKTLFRIELKDIWMFIGTGLVSVSMYNLLGFSTAIEGGVGIAEVLCYTSPVFITILSAILFREKITTRKIIAIILTITGCVFVAGIIGNGYKFSAKVIVTGVLSGFFYGMYTIFGRYALKKYHPLTVTTWTFVIGCIGNAFLGNVPATAAIIADNPSAIVWCLCLGILSASLPYMMYTLGLSMIEAGKAAVLSSSELVVGAFVGVILFGEPIDALKVLGVALVIFAIVLLNIEIKPSAV